MEASTRLYNEDLVNERYKQDGAYSYRRGWNPVALKAFVPAAVVSIVLALVHTFHNAAASSWFVGAGLAALLYMALSRAPAASGEPQRFAREDEMAKVA